MYYRNKLIWRCFFQIKETRMYSIIHLFIQLINYLLKSVNRQLTLITYIESKHPAILRRPGLSSIIMIKNFISILLTIVSTIIGHSSRIPMTLLIQGLTIKIFKIMKITLIKPLEICIFPQAKTKCMKINQHIS